MAQPSPRPPINDVSSAIIGAAVEVHRTLGPGLLESAYEQSLAHEFSLRQIAFERQKPLQIDYKGMRLECGYRLDFLVADLVVVEVKAIELLLPIHQAQLLSYLKLGGWKLGLLINFHAPLLRQGIKRVVLGLEEVPRSATSQA
jgi:GxxExxY protein